MCFLNYYFVPNDFPVPGSVSAMFKIVLSLASEVTQASLLEVQQHLDQNGNTRVIVFIVLLNIDLLVLNQIRTLI